MVFGHHASLEGLLVPPRKGLLGARPATEEDEEMLF